MGQINLYTAVEEMKAVSKAEGTFSINASHKLFLVDTETGNALNCWQILVVEFNGQKTVL